MHFNIVSKLGATVNDSGFSIDELVVRMQDLFTQKAFPELLREIRKGGYVKAANYLERAKTSVFTYVRRWLLLGIACPKASSFIERTMRELGRRIKKLAYNWKEEGLKKVSSILLKVFASNEEWEEYWRRRMDLNRKILLTFKLEKSLCG